MIVYGGLGQQNTCQQTKDHPYDENEQLYELWGLWNNGEISFYPNCCETKVKIDCATGDGYVICFYG